MKRLFLACVLALPATSVEAGSFGVSAGGGFRTSEGSATLMVRAALPRNDSVELVAHAWSDAGQRTNQETQNSLIGAAYRWQMRFKGVQLGAALGAGLVGHETFNLDKNANVMLAPFVRMQLGGGWQLRCEIVHYSSTGDQPGENFAMCGSERELK